jgi:TonB-dependent receptor
VASCHVQSEEPVAPKAGQEDKQQPPGPEPAPGETKRDAEQAVPTLPEVRVEGEAGKGVPEAERLASPVPHVTTKREDFSKRANRRVGDVIERMPGVFVEGPPGENKDIRLRGLDKEFTRVQVDGIQLPDGGEKREFQVSKIPSFSVESVEIIRNPTAEYESDGLAGRVKVTTRGIPEKPFVEGRLGYGGHGDINGGIKQGAIAWGIKPVDWFGVTGAFDATDDTRRASKAKRFSTGKVEREMEERELSFKTLNLDFGFFYGPGELHIKPVYMRVDEEPEKTKTVREPTKPGVRDLEGEDKLVQTKGASLVHKHQFDEIKWETVAGFFANTEEKDKHKSSFKEKAGAFALDKRSPEVEDKEDRTFNVASSVTVPFEALVRHEVKAGGAFRTRERFRDKEKFDISASGVRKSTTEPKDNYALDETYFAGFVQDAMRPIDTLTVLPGVRVEHVDLTSEDGGGTEGASRFTDVNPSLHLLYQVRKDLSVRFAFSRSVNRPKFDELSPFEQEKPDRITVGNPALKPARAWNFDLGLEYATQHIFLGVNAFHKEISDAIEEVDTGMERNSKPVFQVLNVGDGFLRGLEFEQRFNLGITGVGALEAFDLWSNQTLLDSELQSADGETRRFKEQPRFLTNLGIDYTYRPFNTTFTIVWKHVAERPEFKVNGIKVIEATNTVDLSLHQRLHKNLSAFIEASNVTNAGKIERERFNNGTWTRKEDEIGRSFMVGLQWKF